MGRMYGMDSNNTKSNIHTSGCVGGGGGGGVVGVARVEEPRGEQELQGAGAPVFCDI